MEKLLLSIVLLKVFSLEVLADTHLLKPPYCGKSNLSSLKARIFNGTITGIDEYPWLGYVETNFVLSSDQGNTTTDFFSCTSSLINSNWILTAAHCLLSKKSPSFIKRTINVRLGEWDILNNGTDCDKNKKCAPKAISLAAADVFVHPKYRNLEESAIYDIALLRLERKVDFSPYIQPICLPLEPIAGALPSYVGCQVVITGWGRYNDITWDSQFKRKASVTVKALDSKLCRKQFGKFLPFSKRNQLCVGGPDGGGCSGDSGGPLLLLQRTSAENIYYQIGINSLDRLNCTNTSIFNSMTSIYVRVDAFIDWIVKTIKQNDTS